MQRKGATSNCEAATRFATTHTHGHPSWAASARGLFAPQGSHRMMLPIKVSAPAEKGGPGFRRGLELPKKLAQQLRASTEALGSSNKAFLIKPSQEPNLNKTPSPLSSADPDSASQHTALVRLGEWLSSRVLARRPQRKYHPRLGTLHALAKGWPNKNAQYDMHKKKNTTENLAPKHARQTTTGHGRKGAAHGANCIFVS